MVVEGPYLTMSDEAIMQVLLSLKLVDEEWYRETNGLSDDDSSIAHFLTEGWRCRAAPNPFFEPTWYLSVNPDIPHTDDPLTHYIAYGEAEGRWPCRLLDPVWYAVQHGLTRFDRQIQQLIEERIDAGELTGG